MLSITSMEWGIYGVGEGKAGDVGHKYAFSIVLPGKVGFANKGLRCISGEWTPRDAHPLRCIQDR